MEENVSKGASGDTLGCLLESFVVAANHYDGVIAFQQWQVFGRSNILLTNLKKV